MEPAGSQLLILGRTGAPANTVKDILLSHHPFCRNLKLHALDLVAPVAMGKEKQAQAEVDYLIKPQSTTP